jgi:hypothetical protein
MCFVWTSETQSFLPYTILREFYDYNRDGVITARYELGFLIKTEYFVPKCLKYVCSLYSMKYSTINLF